MTWIRNVGLLLVGAFVFAIVVGAFSGEDQAAPSADKARSEPAASSSPAAAANECERVPRFILDGIEEGLTVSGGGKLRNGWAVRSRDFSRVWFISAEIDGPGMDGVVGTWATNKIDDYGLIFAADGIAKEFSDWGADAPERFSVTGDGVADATDCVRKRG